MIERRRIALYGGTFDPMHRGHVEPLKAAMERTGWEKIVYIPAAQQPFKLGYAATSAYHRWAMAAMATEREQRLLLSSIEIERGEVSYTIDTLEQIRREEPDAVLDWVIGDDNLEMLHQWRSIEKIFSLANFVVLRRSGAPMPETLRARVAAPEDRPDVGAVIPVENSKVEISATDVRRRVRAGQPIGDLVVRGVEEYILKYNLYTDSRNES